MKIIDAHLHQFDPAQYEMETGGASPFPAPDELPELYKKLDIRCGVVMGNETLSRDAYRLPPQFRYCIGVGDYQRSLEPDDETLELVEYHLRRKECAGIKVYTGYAPVYAGDKCLAPYYRLAGKYGKAVAFHTGMTADNMGRLKYSHPLTLDDAAAAFPDVQFVMCHFGNPFLADAAAVLEKNPNVAADLSGLLEGVTDLDRYFQRQSGYVEALRTWMRYVDDDSRFMFGTDYPAVDVANYVDFISRLVGEESLENVFFNNANKIYKLGF